MRVLIVGSGFVGRALAAHLIAEGHGAVVASRHPVSPVVGGDPLPWLQLDVTDRAACAAAVRQSRAESVVLVHGPSDVTWCEANPARAEEVHLAGARHLADAAAGRRLVMISTDNVFDGTAQSNDEDSPPRPANAYGRAKLAAERVVRELPSATVLRVSLVYGQEPPGAKWLNFFAACADRLRRGEPVAAPVDQWVTPVLVDDVARVTAAVACAPAPELLHLGGPDRLSRAEWAGTIARRLGVPDDLVTPVPRATSRYASRPENSCLTSRLLPHHPATAHLSIRGVDAGAAHLLGAAPIAEGVPR
ncbi:SDR family oxidoreductase [Micromonospora sp. NPDC048898]|uniref:SDR family oxidoreductase n=1 Tax=Micromonospora sp. NPDC048898 TaxID=3364260 RepID=UPI003724C481